MKFLKKYVFTSYLLIGLIGLMFSFLYLFSPHFMPYHAAAVKMEWNEINPDFQVLILALMRVSGGGWLATSGSILTLLVFSYKKERYWINPAILILGLSVLIPTFIATISVKLHTMGNPPWILTAVMIINLITAFIFSTINRLKNENRVSSI